MSCCPVQAWGRVPALNTNPTFINDLAAMVLEKLPSAAPRPGYVPSLNDSMNLGPIPGERHFHIWSRTCYWSCMSCLLGAFLFLFHLLYVLLRFS